MRERSPVEQLDAILDDAGAAFADAPGLACSTAELREHARRRVRASLVCRIDDMLAETMPGIELERSRTIAQGAVRCDFRYRRSR